MSTGTTERATTARRATVTKGVRRVVTVTRRTEYEQLLARHATRSQARFFLEQRGQDIDTVEDRHLALEAALHVAGGRRSRSTGGARAWTGAT